MTVNRLTLLAVLILGMALASAPTAMAGEVSVDDPVVSDEVTTTDDTTQDESTSEEVVEESEVEAVEDTSTTDTAVESAQGGTEKCVDVSGCDSTTEKCVDPEGCEPDEPKCVIDCNPPEEVCAGDCEPPEIDDECIDCNEEELGEEAPPVTRGGGSDLPFTGIGDVMLAIALGLIGLAAGWMLYRYASVREVLFTSRRALHDEHEATRIRSGYGSALRAMARRESDAA